MMLSGEEPPCLCFRVRVRVCIKIPHELKSLSQMNQSALENVTACRN